MRNGALSAANGTSNAVFGCAPVSHQQESPYVLARRYLNTFGKLPDFVEENLRDRARGVNYLDPDIACKKTWSLNVKIMAQRERNYQQLLDRYKDIGNYDSASSAFTKLTGFIWPW